MSFDIVLNGAEMTPTRGFAIRDHPNYLSVREFVVIACGDEGFQVGARTRDEDGQPSYLRCHFVMAIGCFERVWW